MKRCWLIAIAGVLGYWIWAGVAVGDEPAKADVGQGWITFLSRREGPVNMLYKARPDGSQVTRVFGGKLDKLPVLDKDRSVYMDAHWTWQSPNGKWFASWAKESLVPMSNSDAQFFMIHLGAIDGSWTRVLAPDGEEDLAWSPDSTQIAYSVLSGRRGVLSPGYLCSKVSSSEIMTIGIDGSNMTYVLEQPGVWRVRDWSPDGKKLLLWHEMTEVRSENTVEAVGEVVEYALARALASRKKPVSGILGRGDKEPTMGARYLKPLVFGTATFAPQSARYSPDGKQIAFVYVDPTRPGEIVRVRDIVRWHCWGKLAICDIATGTIRTIADPPGGIWTGPICWSPDGQEILITRYLAAEDEREKSEGSPSMGIWAVTADGKKERFITTGWSPDWR